MFGQPLAKWRQKCCKKQQAFGNQGKQGKAKNIDNRKCTYLSRHLCYGLFVFFLGNKYSECAGWLNSEQHKTRR